MILLKLRLLFHRVNYACLFLLFFISYCCSAQTSNLLKPITQMTNQTQYPRIEVYSEALRGNPNSGNKSWTLANGSKVYGGDNHAEFHITRKTFILDEEQTNKLLKIVLNGLPFFDSRIESITFQHYFDAVKNADKSNLKNLLPESLEAFNNKQLTDKTYPYFGTLLNYEKSNPKTFTVVWLDEQTYYVDNMYFSAGNNLDKFIQNGDTASISQISFSDFLRLSPVFQYKITEGFQHINLQFEKNPLPLDQAVMGISLSPGMPNTTSYDIKIAGDGSYIKKGNKTQDKINLNKLTDLLLEAQKFNWKSYSQKAAKQPVNDGQTFTLLVWKDGVLYTINNPDTTDNSSNLADFINMVKETLQEN